MLTSSSQALLVKHAFKNPVVVLEGPAGLSIRSRDGITFTDQQGNLMTLPILVAKIGLPAVQDIMDKLVTRALSRENDQTFEPVILE